MNALDAPPDIRRGETEEPVTAPGSWRDLVAHLRRSRAGLVGVAITVPLVVLALLGPWLPFLPDPHVQDLYGRLQPPVGWGGSWHHPLGTDQLGRDLLARLIEGARVSILIGMAAVAVSAVVGTVLGLIAGYYGGWVDGAIMSIADVQIAFPGVLAGLVLISAFGAGLWLVVVVIVMSGWMVFTRVTRGLVLSLKSSLFVEAAQLNGARPKRIMMRHLLPNLFSSLITLMVLEFAAAVLAESTFSFLGFGVQPPQASWGLIIAQGRTYVTEAWWIVTFAGSAIALTVFGLNMLTFWLQSFNDVAERERMLIGG